MPKIDPEVREFVEWVLYEAAKAEERLKAFKNSLKTLSAVHGITIDMEHWVIKDDL